MGRSHAITKGVAGDRDVTFRTYISSAVEFVMTPSVTVEAGSPVVDMGIREQLIILGKS